MPYLRALSSFRDQIRQLAMSGAPSSEILALTDRLRDVEMVDLGVALDDQDGTGPRPLLFRSSNKLTSDDNRRQGDGQTGSH
jgi:hypothetical protein